MNINDIDVISKRTGFPTYVYAEAVGVDMLAFRGWFAYGGQPPLRVKVVFDRLMKGDSLGKAVAYAPSHARGDAPISLMNRSLGQTKKSATLLRDALAHLGVTQEAFARYLGLHRNTVYGWLQRRKAPIYVEEAIEQLTALHARGEGWR